MICIPVRDSFYPRIRSISKGLIKAAMNFRLREKKRGLSYADALGYQMALELNVTFLTSDSAFKGLANVNMI